MTNRHPLIQAMFDAIKAVQTAEKPDAIVTKKGNLRCPHCKVTNRIQERVYDIRVNEGEYNGDGTLMIYQGDDEYETMCYECDACGGLVSMPDDVTVDWS